METQQTANITDNIAAMATGANFVSIVRPASAARTEEKDAANGTSTTTGTSADVEKREVFVWYEAADSKLGTLYWCDVGTKQKVPGQSLPLHRVSDVNSGKQAVEMQSVEASPYPPHCCFSIIAKEKAIHLIAPSEAVRATWVQGIWDVFANGGKKVIDDRDSNDAFANVGSEEKDAHDWKDDGFDFSVANGNAVERRQQPGNCCAVQ